MRKFCVALAVAATVSCGGPQKEVVGSQAVGLQAVTVVLPPGDAQAGRAAFADLKCTACHAVPSEPDLPAPVGDKPGPPIDAQLGRRDPSYLVTAIVSPSHQFSTSLDERVRGQLTGVLSPMGDFSHAMTVRQLVDLQAFLRAVQ